MRQALQILLLTTLAGCIHLAAGSSTTPEPVALWDEAHRALTMEEFRGAEAAFQQLVREYPDGTEGREALFYLGTLHLDPRNPGWNPDPAVNRFRAYLSLDREEEPIYRRPEAEILLRLAEQLALPPEQRVVGLQPGMRIITVPQRAPPAEQDSSLVTEVERLRRELAERDEQIREQQEELERIRRTLTPPTP